MGRELLHQGQGAAATTPLPPPPHCHQQHPAPGLIACPKTWGSAGQGRAGDIAACRAGSLHVSTCLGRTGALAGFGRAQGCMQRPMPFAGTPPCPLHCSALLCPVSPLCPACAPSLSPHIPATPLHIQHLMPLAKAQHPAPQQPHSGGQGPPISKAHPQHARSPPSHSRPLPSRAAAWRGRRCPGLCTSLPTRCRQPQTLCTPGGAMPGAAPAPQSPEPGCRGCSLRPGPGRVGAPLEHPRPLLSRASLSGEQAV